MSARGCRGPIPTFSQKLSSIHASKDLEFAGDPLIAEEQIASTRTG